MDQHDADPGQVREVAVIGSGIAGLAAAHALNRTPGTRVTLYEADDRPGGHAHTHRVTLADGTQVGIDSGFIVHNERTYPTLLRIFADLDVPTQATDMSMSISGGERGWQYAGGQGIRGILGDPRTAGSPAFLRMLLEIKRFHAAARRLLDEPAGSGHPDGLEVGAWLAEGNFSDTFLDHFARPVVAAVWSCDADDAMRYPARSLLTFLDHHGMLGVTGSPTWRTVTGGSAEYVRRIVAETREVRLNRPVTGLRRLNGRAGVEVTDADGPRCYDAAVVATHPHQALRLLDEPTTQEQKVLDSIRYSVNPAQLHTDASLLPTTTRVRASWNYRLPEPGHHTDGVLVSYDLTRLMRLPSPGGQRVLVTLNGADRVDPATVIAEMTYEHPLYTSESLAAQRRLPDLSDDLVAFAGAYHGWGFHEDGALSGVAAAHRLGGTW